MALVARSTSFHPGLDLDLYEQPWAQEPEGFQDWRPENVNDNDERVDESSNDDSRTGSPDDSTAIAANEDHVMNVNDNEESQLTTNEKDQTETEQSAEKCDDSFGGARPKDFTKDSVPHKNFDKEFVSGTRKTKAKCRSRKVRQRKLKKWQPVNTTELGFCVPFYVSCEDDTLNESETSATLCEDSSCDSACNTNMDSTYCDATTVSSDNSCIRTSANNELTKDNERITEHTSDNLVNDPTFFQSMGIDISFSANLDYSDNIDSWDGLRFREYDHLSEKALKLKKTQVGQKHNNAKLKSSNSSSVKSDSSKSVLVKNTKPVLETRVCSTFLKRYDVRKLHELECSSKSKVFVRRNKDQRKRKIHKEVKSKHCAATLYNPSRKKVYIHHRLYKILGGDAHNLWSGRLGPARMSSTVIDHDVARSVVRSNAQATRAERQVRSQNLHHAIHETNRPRHLGTDLASFLISLQHREMTPEDYEMLLRLDESVKPKTVSTGFIGNLETDTVQEDSEGLECSVCMDVYTLGQQRKFLPCGHAFHSECIENWLKNCSKNCPLDGLPVEDS